MHVVGRILLLPFAMLAAALATGFVIVTLGQERIVQAMASRQIDDVAVGAAVDMLALGLALISVHSLLPPLLLVIVGEVARIRSALYYIVGGGVSIALVPLLVRLADPGQVLGLSPTVWQVLATAGFAGGLVYWLIAGRNA